ncbi:MAG: S8 family serine peptidase [Acidimicrobiales bacterium]
MPINHVPARLNRRATFPMGRLCAIGSLAAIVAGLVAPSAAGAGEAPSMLVTFDTTDHVRHALEHVSAFRNSHRIGGRTVAVASSELNLASLAGAPGVLAVESDVTYRAADLPNDPCISSPGACNGLTSSYVNQIDLDAAWSNSRGSGTTIAVLDGGVDPGNADVASKLVAGEIDYVGDGASTHGTSVAAIAGAATNNGVGIAGTGWNAGLRSYKVLDQSGAGLLSDVISALNAAADTGAQVITMAFAGPASVALDEAIASARNKGSVIVAAAGNDAGATPVYPAASPGVIAVGSSTSSDTIAPFSNTGSWVDLYAPGVGVPAPNSSGAIAPFTGTSASTPIVAGIVALMRARSPGLTVDQVADLLTSTAVAIGSGALRVDAGRAVSTWSPYSGLANGLRIAGGNVDGDTDQEVVTGAGSGGGPHVIVADRTGPILGSFYAYDPGFRGGVDVTTGDLDGDGHDEIVTGAGPGGGPHVRGFNASGAPVASFFAYDPGFTGGVNVAAGDVDGDGRDEIVTGAGAGGGPNVTVRRADGTLLASFFAYDPQFTGGVDVATGDLDGDGRDEIITGAGAGGGPHVRAFSLGGTPYASFFAYDPGFAGGVRVGTVDLEGDGRDEILTGPGPGGGPHVTARRADGTIVLSFYAVAPGFTGGIDVGGFSGSLLVGTLTQVDTARIIAAN